jgi:hypothetical protein
VRGWRLFSAIAIAVALALLVGACGGDDDDNMTTSPAPAQTPVIGGAAPQGDLSQLPPEFVECMADQGYEIESPAEIHAAPPEVLQKCFGSAH